MAGARGFNPWRWLRERPEVFVTFTPLPQSVGGGLYVPAPDGSADILIDRRLGQVERNAVLVHEVGHHEGICERRMADWQAQQLVPLDELAAHVEVLVLNELPVYTWEVAEHFGVPDRVADRALRLLKDREAA